MSDRNRLISEVSRMIELSSHGSKNDKLIKESFQGKVNKKIVKESEGEDFAFDLGDVFDDEGAQGNLAPEVSADSKVDIPYPFKIAIVSYDLGNMAASMLELSKDDFVEFGDLRSKPIHPSDEDGTVVYRPGQYLYPISNANEFRELANRGRLVVKWKGDAEEMEDTQKVFKWLGGSKGGKDFNLIGLTNLGKLSPRGKETLNFLARILSNQPKDDKEQKIVDYVKGAKNNAYRILQTYYNLAVRDMIASIFSKPSLKNNRELLEFAEDGVAIALAKLAGGGREGAEDPRDARPYDATKNVTPWIFQIVKNHVIDRVKKVAGYKANLASAEKYFTEKLADEGVIIIRSRKEPTGRDNASKVEQEGVAHLYYYDNIDDALDDLRNAPHMQPNFLKSEQIRALYDSHRRAASPMKDIEGKVEAPSGEPKDARATEAIKKTLSDIIEFMSLDSKKYGVSAKHSENLNASQEKLPEDQKEKLIKRKQTAKRILVNFLYDFLIQMGGTEDVGISGKAVFLKDWIEDYNKETFEQVKEKYPSMDDADILKAMKKNGYLISGDVQGLYKGLKDYFGGEEAAQNRELIQNKDAFDKIKELIGSAEFDVERKPEDIMLERKQMIEKIREKIQETLKESLTLKEIEDDVLGNTRSQIRTIGDKMSRTSWFPKGEDLDMLNREVEAAINTGGGTWNTENISKDRAGILKYVFTVAAAMYQLVNDRQKKNIESYIYSALLPNNIDSAKGMLFLGMAGGLNVNDPDIRDIVYDSVVVGSKETGMTTIQEALESFNPERGYDFLSYLTTRIINRTKSRMQTELPSYKKGDERVWVGKQSLDAPVDDDEETTLLGKMGEEPAEDVDYQSREYAKNVMGAFLGFMNERLQGKRALLDILGLFGDDRAYDDKNQFNNQLVANILDTSVGAVRKNKAVLMKIIRDAIESGELRDFILENAGVDINKMPKIIEFFKTGELKIGTYGSGSKASGEEEMADALSDEDDFVFECVKEFRKLVI